MNCLRCLEKQVLEKNRFEVIVVSDGYDAETESVLNEFMLKTPMQIRYMHTPEKKGPAGARNMGWKAACADLVAFTDDDCRPEPSWLKSFLNHYSGELFVAFSGFTKVPVPAEPTDFALNTYHLQTADFITANCACSRQALLQTGGFDERFGTAWREDSDLEFALIKHHIPVLKIHKAVVEHPVRHAPWGVSLKEQKKGIYDSLLYKKHPDLYRWRIQSTPLWNYYIIVFSYVFSTVAFIYGFKLIAAILAGVALILTLEFFLRRIRRSSKSPSHVTEMLVTSFLIPFLSVYWRLYGNLKYRTLLL